MAAPKSRDKVDTVRVIRPFRKEGWFCYQEIEIPLDLLEKEGKVVEETEPDIFQIFADQVTRTTRRIFNI